MRGLLIKDLYTLVKQMKIFLVIMVLWSIIPNFSASLFAIVYSAMLPVTAIAYDERSKWSTLAATMPYSSADIVLSKYLLGYIFTVTAAVFCLGAKLILGLFGYPDSSDSIASIPVIVCIALLMEAVNLPCMFKLGVEKGRFLLIIIALAIVSASTFAAAALDANTNVNGLASSAVVYVAAIVIAAIANVLSILISIKICKNKE